MKDGRIIMIRETEALATKTTVRWHRWLSELIESSSQVHES